MNRLDKLLEKARELSAKDLILAVIDLDGDCWRTYAHMRNGQAGGGVHIESTVHATQSAAVEHIRGIAGDCPDVPVIICDV